MNSNCLFLILCATFASADQCLRFKQKTNVTISCSEQDYANFSSSVDVYKCLELCIEKNCTAFTIKNESSTDSCCFLKTETINYHNGNYILIHKRDVQLQCNSNFKNTSSCDDCKQGMCIFIFYEENTYPKKYYHNSKLRST